MLIKECFGTETTFWLLTNSEEIYDNNYVQGPSGLFRKPDIFFNAYIRDASFMQLLVFGVFSVSIRKNKNLKKERKLKSEAKQKWLGWVIFSFFSLTVSSISATCTYKGLLIIAFMFYV